MIRSPRAWALEQNDRRTVFATGPEATMFAESRPFHVARHRLPAWKAVLPIGGHAELLQPGRPLVAAPGLIVPPQLVHACAATSPYLALFIDSWLLPPCPGPVQLDGGEVRRLLAALGTTDSDGPGVGADLGAGYAGLRTLAGRPSPLDPRVAHAVDLCTLRDPDLPIASIAAEVGLSAPRLRALVRQDVGISLAHLRRWGRLRTAIAGLPDSTAALAAAGAGFADQAHLTRTARDFTGRTPASLKRWEAG
ncbi:helix-turn-helix domain-containing protein [Streptomyces sp. TLI_146]|uniref:helix-turn-helix domain-containing protein n=1 Tax=Streptomyces sp. TLI_146 TaxID=1938858 RepID=UPI00214C11A4|nr:helix-turn-helix domain-containing protein [Streptomyces sp. TLI_146]